jgi:hypothetical protein
VLKTFMHGRHKEHLVLGPCDQESVVGPQIEHCANFSMTQSRSLSFSLSYIFIYIYIYIHGGTKMHLGAFTTGLSFFAECRRHSAKTILHSAKNARRTVYRQQPLCRVLFVGHSAKILPSAV